MSGDRRTIARKAGRIVISDEPIGRAGRMMRVPTPIFGIEVVNAFNIEQLKFRVLGQCPLGPPQAHVALCTSRRQFLMRSDGKRDSGDFRVEVAGVLSEISRRIVDDSNTSLLVWDRPSQAHVRIDGGPRTFPYILNPLLLVSEMYERFVCITSNRSGIVRGTAEDDARSMIAVVLANLDIFVDYASYQSSDGGSGNYCLRIADCVPPMAWLWLRRVLGGLALCGAALVFYCGFIFVDIHGFTPATLAGLVLIDLFGFAIASLGCVGLIG
jgi:hypothetical protein